MDVRSAWAQARERRWVRWVTDLVLLAAVAVMTWQTRHFTRGPLPDVSLRSLDGKVHRLAELRGAPALVVVWAPWCGVCKVESPSVSWLQRLVGDSAHVVSVAFDYDDVEQVRRYMREQEVDYPVLLGDEAAREALRVQSFPTLLFLSPEGELRHAAVGYTTLPGMLVRLWL